MLHPSTPTQTRTHCDTQLSSIQAQPVISSTTLIAFSHTGHQRQETLYGQGIHEYGSKDTGASISTYGVQVEIEQYG